MQDVYRFRMHLSILFLQMTRPDSPEKSPVTPRPAKPRIQTQIHRRQKAKAVPPMEDEWDDQSEHPVFKDEKIEVEICLSTFLQANEYTQKTREGHALTGLRSYGSSGTTY